MALWLSFAVGLAMFALEGGSRAQTAAIVTFQFTPAALVAPLRLLRKPRLGPRAIDGCLAVQSVLGTGDTQQHAQTQPTVICASSEQDG